MAGIYLMEKTRRGPVAVRPRPHRLAAVAARSRAGGASESADGGLAGEWTARMAGWMTALSRFVRGQEGELRLRALEGGRSRTAAVRTGAARPFLVLERMR